MIEALTRAESAELAKCEEAIARGLRSYVEVGRALAAVRDARLYRATHPTFEAYCRERWGFSRPYAYQVIDAAAVVSAMADSDPKPATERVARELLRAPEAERAAVWREALAAAPGGHVTARAVREIIEANEPEAPPPASARESRAITEATAAALAAVATLDPAEREAFLWHARMIDADDLVALATEARDEECELLVARAVLGVKLDAPASEIKAVVKRAARVVHPDRGGSNEALALITWAARVAS